MSLRARVQQIAAAAAKDYVNGQTALVNNKTTSANSVQAGIIQAYSNGAYTVILNDGSVISVLPGGLRPLSPGCGVLIANGAIIG